MTARHLAVLVATSQGAVPPFVSELAGEKGCRPAGPLATLEDAAQAVVGLQPDVAVLHVRSLDEIGRFVTPVARSVATVVVSDLRMEPGLLASMACGARAFVLVPLEPGILGQAIAAAASGRTYVDPRGTAWLVELALRGRMATSASGLSLRQSQVLELARGGLRNQEIADLLGVSTETVKTHVKKGMRRLDARDRREAAARAGGGECRGPRS